MLSPAASWLNAAGRADSQVRVLLSITDGVTTWSALSGSCSAFDYPATIVGVGTVASEVDPLSREPSASECVVEVQDAWIRPILVNNRLKGKKATLKIGFTDTAEADFLALFAGPIEEINPKGGKDSGIVSISVQDVFTVLEKSDVAAWFFNLHPLQALYDGSHGVLDKIGWPDIDTTSFDPTTATYSSTISHFVVSRIEDVFVQAKPALDIVKELCSLMNGQLVQNEAGDIGFKFFNASNAAVDDWTIDDFIPGSFEQSELDENIINRVSIKFGTNINRNQNTYTLPPIVFQIDDTDSQSAFVYPGQSERVLTYELETPWLPIYHNKILFNGSLLIGASAISYCGTQPHCWCGTRGSEPGPQDATSTISATRKAWFLIKNYHSTAFQDTTTEIISCETLTPLANSICASKDNAAIKWRGYVGLSNINRAQLGTSEIDHIDNDAMQSIWLTDITIPVYLAQSLLARFKYGCPIIKLSTPINKFAVQQGDFVTLTTPDFLAYGTDGLTSAIKWEVVGKEVDPLGTPPMIRWTLAKAGADTTTTTKGDNFRATANPIGDPFVNTTISSNSWSDRFSVPSGYTISKTSGLAGSIAAGAVLSSAGRNTMAVAQAYTFTASKDTYVTVNALTGALSYYAVASITVTTEFMNQKFGQGLIVLRLAAHQLK
jgi:hypothetical protein